MTTDKFLISVLCAAGMWAATLSAQSKVGRVSAWCPDCGDGTYVNPVLHADYSDPDACAVGDDYYLTASSFACTPGLPVLHSRDLVNWHIIGHALPRLEPEDFYAVPRHGKGVWAPSIRYHDGHFYIYWGDPDYGIYMVSAENPAGEWSKPVLVKAGRGLIDPCPLWDEDGKCYLVFAWAASRAGINSVLCAQQLTDDGRQVVGNPVMVYDGNADDNHTAEGPKWYKRNGYYYIMCPAGGVEQGWQLAMRSRQVFGPYEVRRVMEQGTTGVNGPHQGAWVPTSSGEDWFLHFQDKGCYGRVVHLQPMTWNADWPVIGEDPDGDGCGQPVMRYAKPRTDQSVEVCIPQTSDEFDTAVLAPQWQWHANYADAFGFPSLQGYFRLYNYRLEADTANLWTVPNLLLQKFPAEEFEVTARVKLVSKADGQRGGIVVMGWDYASLYLERQGDRFLLCQALCTDAEQVTPEHIMVLTELQPTERQTIKYSPTVSCELYLRVRVTKGGQCRFYYSNDGKRFKGCGQSFKARQGKWIGAKVGCMSVATAGSAELKGWLDIDWFRVKGICH